MDEPEAIIVVEVRYLRGLEARVKELEGELDRCRAFRDEAQAQANGLATELAMVRETYEARIKELEDRVDELKQFRQEQHEALECVTEDKLKAEARIAELERALAGAEKP